MDPDQVRGDEGENSHSSPGYIVIR